MRLPKFRLQTLFMFVLICASALVSVESLITHRREREAQAKIAGLQKIFGMFEEAQHNQSRENAAMVEVGRKHGLLAEMGAASTDARLRDEREQKVKADKVAKLP
jgi:hypothetical protein